MRRILISFALVTFASPVAAEVCDKALGESWRQSDGPVWMLNPVGFPIGLTILIATLALLVITKSDWSAYVAAGLAMSFAALGIWDMIEDHFVYQAEIREGCRSIRTDIMQFALLTAFAAAYGWLGYRLSKKNVKAI